MALAVWKDLVIDGTDAAALGGFWGRILGLNVEVFDDGDAVLRGATPEQTIWVNRVPEPKTVKHRVHIDLNVRSLQPLLDAGATVLRPEGDDGIRWTALADPEGGEFDAFVRPELPAEPIARPYELGIDTASSESAAAQARWWADVLDAKAVDDPARGFSWVEGIAGSPFESLDFAAVPEPKTVKNRVHWDVICDDIEGLVARGATVLRTPDDDIDWHVMADPGGNEFCAMPSKR